jgi:hypothetical protein
MRQKITYDPARDYYTILGIEVNATGEEVRLAYRRCVREVHPDLNPQRADWATEQLQRVNEAYDVLHEPALRREYDRQRWPHVPNRPVGAADTAYHSPFSPPYYDRDRPWWDQVAHHAPGSYPFSEADRRHPNRRSAPGKPYWMKLSAWLKAHRLAALERTWLSLVGLWRSPYAGVLSVLGMVLSVNVAVIVYVFISPDANLGFFDLPFSNREAVVSGPFFTSTPTRLETDCRDPNIQIAQPGALDEVGDTFSIVGTVSHAEMWAYRIEMGYLGAGFAREAVPVAWEEVRSAPYNQSIPEPFIISGLLADVPVDLTHRPAGYYVIRLVVLTQSGTTLPACDVVVKRQ